MDTHYGCARECKGDGIPPQHYPRLLPGPGGACTNSMGDDKKRDDIFWNTTFDDILKEHLPPWVNIIYYTDDTQMVTIRNDIPMLKWKETPLSKL